MLLNLATQGGSNKSSGDPEISREKRILDSFFGIWSSRVQFRFSVFRIRPLRWVGEGRHPVYFLSCGIWMTPCGLTRRRSQETFSSESYRTTINNDAKKERQGGQGKNEEEGKVGEDRGFLWAWLGASLL